jgi:CCR4-NOT transcription complex subunit 3
MNPGVIGRRSVTDLGAIGDNLTPALGREHFAAQHEALEHAYRNLPLPKDSERPKSYTPVTTCSTLLFCLRFCLFC